MTLSRKELLLLGLAFGFWQKARPERLAREQSMTAGLLSPLLQHDVEQERAFVPWPAFGLWQKARPERLTREPNVTAGMLSPIL
jgi:hypothetical protein